MTIFCILYSDLSIGEEPILISDVLLTHQMTNSSDDDRYQKIYLPSTGGRFPELQENNSILGMMQKTYITDRHTFAIAGSKSAAAVFHRDMSEAVTLEDFLSTCKKHRPALQFAAFTLDARDDRPVICISDDCIQLKPGDYGLVVLGGSGDSSIRKLILNHQASHFNVSEDMACLGRALCLVSAALALDEDIPSESLNQYFGAYYEVSIYGSGTFKKLDRVLYSYWDLTAEDEALQWTPTKMFYHEYVNGVLIVRRITISSFNGNAADIWQDCYGIGSLSDASSDELVRWQISSFAPAPIIEVINVKFRDNEFRIVDAEPLLTFERNKDRWKIHRNIDVLNRHSDAIANMLDKL